MYGFNVLAAHFKAMQRSVFEAFAMAILAGLNTFLHLRTQRHTHVIVFHLSLLFEKHQKPNSSKAM
jgi:hypothetical protein